MLTICSYKENLMKRLISTGVLVLAALGLSVTTAFADNGTGNGNGTDVFHYSLAYTDLNGPVNCIGVHQSGKNFPGNATSGGQDSFTCTSTTGLPLTGGAFAGQVIPLPVGGWQSDYFFGAFHISVINTIPSSLIVSADVFSYSGVVGYY
jgi:hypothetical protein